MKPQLTPSQQQLADEMVKMFNIPVSEFGKPGFFLYDRNTGELAVAEVKES